MKHNVWQKLWNPRWKTGTFKSWMLKPGHITPVIYFLTFRGFGVEESGKCLLEAGAEAESVRVACSRTHFQLVCYMEECCWNVFSCANDISWAQVALQASNYILALIWCQKEGEIIMEQHDEKVLLAFCLCETFRVVFISKTDSRWCLLMHSSC